MRFVPLLLLCACNVFDASLVENFDAGNDVPAVPDVPPAMDVPRPDTPAMQENGCDGMGTVLPARPDIPDSDGEEIVIGLYELLLNQDGDRWRSIGLNLDALCSRQPVPIIECQPRNEETLPQVDGNGGIDNTFGGRFFDLVNAVAPDLDRTARQASTNGTGALMLRIRGYNGEMDDPRVEVAVLQSVFGFAGTPEQTQPPPFEVVDFDAYQPGGLEQMPFPEWDGSDWLFPRNENFYDDDPENPRVVTVTAYVSGGVLVAELEDNVPFNFASAVRGISVKMTDTRLVVGLQEGNEYSGTAQLSGRWKIQEMLQSARTLEICPGSPQYDILARQIDMLADVLSAPGDDNSVVCDAMSLGVQWDIAPARIGSPALGAVPPNLCDDE